MSRTADVNVVEELSGIQNKSVLVRGCNQRLQDAGVVATSADNQPTPPLHSCQPDNTGRLRSYYVRLYRACNGRLKNGNAANTCLHRIEQLQKIVISVLNSNLKLY